jgi:hypothetical protein
MNENRDWEPIAMLERAKRWWIGVNTPARLEVMMLVNPPWYSQFHLLSNTNMPAWLSTSATYDQ